MAPAQLNHSSAYFGIAAGAAKAMMDAADGKIMAAIQSITNHTQLGLFFLGRKF